jgi:hypothetical protein
MKDKAWEWSCVVGSRFRSWLVNGGKFRQMLLNCHSSDTELEDLHILVTRKECTPVWFCKEETPHRILQLSWGPIPSSVNCFVEWGQDHRVPSLLSTPPVWHVLSTRLQLMFLSQILHPSSAIERIREPYKCQVQDISTSTRNDIPNIMWILLVVCLNYIVWKHIDGILPHI